MTGARIEELASAITGAKHVAISGHVHPDGDCLGSVLALANALRSQGVDVDTLLADGRKPEPYAFLPGYELFIPAVAYAKTPELFIALDTPTPARLGDSYAVLQRSQRSVALDHHPDTQPYADVWATSPESAAVGEVVWDLIDALGIVRTVDIAMCCYTALMTDTGRFQYQNVTATSFAKAGEMVACGANPEIASRLVYQNRTLASIKLDALVSSRIFTELDGLIACSWVTEDDLTELGASRDDIENLIDLVRSVRGTEIAVLFREEGASVRTSLRAKGSADVGSVARSLGGGGHKAAAGLTLSDSLDAVMKLVISKLCDSVAGEA